MRFLGISFPKPNARPWQSFAPFVLVPEISLSCRPLSSRADHGVLLMIVLTTKSLHDAFHLALSILPVPLSCLMFPLLYPVFKPLRLFGFASTTFLPSHLLELNSEVSICSSPHRHQVLMMTIVVQDFNHAICSSSR